MAYKRKYGSRLVTLVTRYLPLEISIKRNTKTMQEWKTYLEENGCKGWSLYRINKYINDCTYNRFLCGFFAYTTDKEQCRKYDELIKTKVDNLPGEVWVKCSNFRWNTKDSFYEISNMGRLRSTFKGYPKLTKLSFDKDGYIVYCGRYLHIAVMKAFGKYVPGLEVDHIDGNRQNCKLDNLRMVTHKQNIRYAVEKGSWKNAYLNFHKHNS